MEVWTKEALGPWEFPLRFLTGFQLAAAERGLAAIWQRAHKSLQAGMGDTENIDKIQEFCWSREANLLFDKEGHIMLFSRKK